MTTIGARIAARNGGAPAAQAAPPFPPPAQLDAANLPAPVHTAAEEKEGDSSRSKSRTEKVEKSQVNYRKDYLKYLKDTHPGTNQLTSGGDINYLELDSAVFLGFLTTCKLKANGNYIRHEPLRRRFNSLVNESDKLEQSASAEFKKKVNTWLGNYKVEAAKARAAGKGDENTSEPLSQALFEWICKQVRR